MNKPKYEELDDTKGLTQGMTIKEMADWDIKEYKHHQEVFDKKTKEEEFVSPLNTDTIKFNKKRT